MKQSRCVIYQDLLFAVLPCLSWGLACQFWVRSRFDICNNCILTSSICYRLWYVAFASLVLLSLLYCYKHFAKDLYVKHSKTFKLYYAFFLMASFACCFVKYPGMIDDLLEGMFVSPFNEELLAHFSLYKFKSYSLRKYLFLAFFSSLAFAMMHWGYGYSKPPIKDMFLATIGRSTFAFIGTALFWVFPRFRNVVLFHSSCNFLAGVLNVLGVWK